MRITLVFLAAAVSALAVASPAAAQWAPVPQGYGYGYAHSNYGQVRALQARVQQLRRTIHRLDERDRLSSREARRLDWHAAQLQRRIRSAAYRGLHPRERFEIERRIEGLRNAIRYQARDGGRWGWNGHGYGNAYGYYGERIADDRRWRDRDDDDHRFDDDDDDDRGGGWNDRRRDRDDD